MITVRYNGIGGGGFHGYEQWELTEQSENERTYLYEHSSLTLVGDFSETDPDDPMPPNAKIFRIEYQFQVDPSTYPFGVTVSGLHMEWSSFIRKDLFAPLRTHAQRIFASSESEIIYSSIRGDAVHGLSGDDIIHGLGGNDRLFGDHGSDILSGGNGNDRLTGGDGADTFVFRRGYDIDTIVDFRAGGAGHDLIDLSRLPAVADFKDLREHHLADHGADVWINAGKDLLVIKHIEILDLGKADFLL